MKKLTLLMALCLVSIVINFLPSEKAMAGSYCANQQASIPVNEIVFRVTGDTSCGNASGNLRLETKVPSSSGALETRCANYGTMPAGFVVTQVSSSSSSCNGETHQIRIPPDSTSSTFPICANQTETHHPGNTLPEGYVIIGVDGGNNNCGTSGVVYDIRKPRINGSVDIVCGQDNLPAGYVVVRNTRSSNNCSTGNQPVGQLDIRTPANNLWICGNYTGIPDGYASIAQDSSYSDCRGFNRSGLAYRLGEPQHNGIVCGAGNVPSGFLKREVGNFAQCDSGIGYRVFAISNISTELEFCGNQDDVPPGYVVTRVRSLSSCATIGTGVALTIRLPANGSVICANYPYPAGYAITSIGSSDNCSTIGSNQTTYTISQVQAGQSYCDVTGFIIPEGMVIRQVSNDGSCSGAGRGRRLAVNFPNTAGSTNICLGLDAPLPDGYVITGVDPSDSNCGPFRQRTIIRLPYANSETTICSTSPVPNGYITKSIGSDSIDLNIKK